jgi:DNA invertase Pin-like site-specific DNA recombinase
MGRIRKNTEAHKLLRPHWNAALYIRLSREDGNDESYSVKNQRQRLMSFYEKLAEQEDVTLVDTYIDDGFTGTDSDRDSFQRMLSDIDSGIITCVIVKDLSRLSRNDWECKRYLQHLFVMKDVRFISLELPALDSFNRPDDVYELGVSIQSMYNENHCRETSVKVRGTFNTKREKGEFIGAFAPYGYKKDPADYHHLIIDDEAAEVVRDVFRWFVRDGMPKNGIMRRLDELGVPCPAVYKREHGEKYNNPHITARKPQWSAKTISGILCNQMYLGHMVQGKQKVKSYKIHTRVAVPEEKWTIIKNTHEPIIEQELFDKAQSLLLRDTRTPPQTTELYLFSGFLRCADCGRGMIRRPTKTSIYYACRSYTSFKQCTRHTIRSEKLEAAVLAAIKAQIALVDGMAEEVGKINKSSEIQIDTSRIEKAIALKQNELTKISDIRKGLYLDWKTGDISRDEYHSMKADFENEEDTLHSELAKLTEELGKLQSGVTSFAPFFDAFRQFGNIENLNRGIITELVKTIRIHEGGVIEIDFTFPDECKRAMDYIESNRELVRV